MISSQKLTISPYLSLSRHAIPFASAVKVFLLTMARLLRSHSVMATRVNMLKLLQEMNGHANFPDRPPGARPLGLMLLPSRSFAARPPKIRKKTLTVIMRDLPDIPAPVAITYIPANAPISAT